MFSVHSKERATSDESSSIEAFQFKVFLLDALAKEDVALGGMENFPELLLFWLARICFKEVSKRVFTTCKHCRMRNEVFTLVSVENFPT